MSIQFDLKPIKKEGIPRALDKVEKYRLLNEPLEAESICRDVLKTDPDNQDAIILFILTLSDRFIEGHSANEANSMLPKLSDPYNKLYYQAIILERQGKAALKRGYPGSGSDAFEWLEEAMQVYEEAIKLSTPENNDAALRYNTCARIIMDRHLKPRPKDDNMPVLDD